MSDQLRSAFVQGRLRKLLIAASELLFAPLPLDIVVLESYHWHVLGVSPLSPAGTPVLYVAIIEQGALSTVDAAAVPLLPGLPPSIWDDFDDFTWDDIG